MKRFRSIDGESGAVALIVAFSTILMFGLGALAVDIGQMYEVRRATQSAVDLSALAGANELPDQPIKACQVAIDYLKKNTPPTVAAFTDDNPLQCTSSGTGRISINPSHTEITVGSNTRTVSFGFATALGFTSGKVASQGTAGIRSVGGVLPFLLAAGVASGSGDICLKANSNGCGSSSSGNFGYANFPRDDTGPSNWIVVNTAQGVEKTATPAIYAAAHDYFYAPGLDWPITKPSANIQCIDPATWDSASQDVSNKKSPTTVSTTGAKTEDDNTKQTPLREGETCVWSTTGTTPDKLTQGLVTYDASSPTSSGCDGKLAVSTSQPQQVQGCNIAPNQWSTYQTGVCLNTAPINGTISGDVVDDPRFGIVPVLTTDASSGGSNAYAIVNFFGVYIDALYDNNGTVIPSTGDYKDKVYAISAHVFSLNCLPPVVGGTPLGGYLGTGPVVPVLVK
jgi:Flp pilus assembly protein TadG